MLMIALSSALRTALLRHSVTKRESGSGTTMILQHEAWDALSTLARNGRDAAGSRWSDVTATAAKELGANTGIPSSRVVAILNAGADGRPFPQA